MGICAICGGKRERFGDAQILCRIAVSYYRCVVCGFIQTESPYWLDQAYADSAIDASDVGHVSRNLRFGSIVRSVIESGLDSSGRFLDFGGGYGLLARLMRDRGFDFYHEDPYCQNLFARGFDRTGMSDSGYELVTAFEVAEHLPDPIEGFRSMFQRGESVLFSTLLVPSPTPSPDEWWYYSLQSGQHVSLYTADALKRLSERLGVSVVTSRDLHLLTNNRRALRAFPFVSGRWSAACRNALSRRRKSLIESDYEKVLTSKS